MRFFSRGHDAAAQSFQGLLPQLPWDSRRDWHPGIEFVEGDAARFSLTTAVAIVAVGLQERFNVPVEIRRGRRLFGSDNRGTQRPRTNK